ARPIPIDDWNYAFDVGDVTLEHWRYRGDSSSDENGSSPLIGRVLPLLVSRDGRPYPAGDRLRLREGDVVTFAGRSGDWEAERERLLEEGWEEIGVPQPR